MVDRKKLIKLYKSGMPLDSMAAEMNVSTGSRVWQMIKPLYQLYKLGKDRRDTDGKPNPREEEKWVSKKLKSLGLNPIHQGYNCSFDILVGNKRIEVKYRTHTSNSQSHNNFWKFNCLVGRERIDYYVFLCGTVKSRQSFIVPAERVKNNLSITNNPKNKNTRKFHKLYKNNWKTIVDAVRSS